jgi:hypothetical protein
MCGKWLRHFKGANILGTSVTICRSTQCYIPEDLGLLKLQCENLQSHKMLSPLFSKHTATQTQHTQIMLPYSVHRCAQCALVHTY